MKNLDKVIADEILSNIGDVPGITKLWLANVIKSCLPESFFESPILAFDKWLKEYTKTTGPLSPREYGTAYNAFIAAHPGEGPHSALFTTTKLLKAKLTNGKNLEME